MRSFVLGAAGCIAAAAALGAQESVQNFASITSYALSIPSGDTRHFITTPSWLGVSWDGVWATGRRTSAGLAFSVSDFNHGSSGTTNYVWGAATGEQMRSLLVTTAMATGHWYPLAEQTRRPHVGLGVGLVHSEETYRLGVSEIVRGATHFAVAPEAGWQFSIVSGVDGLASARYTWPVMGGQYVGGERSYPYLTLSFGILERAP